MEIVDRIPISLDAAEIVKRLRFDPARAGVESLVELVALANCLIKARAVFEAVNVVERGERAIEVNGATFESSLLRKNLDRAKKVFPYIITVGPELEREASAKGDLLEQYYLEEIANIALEKAAEWLSSHLEERFGVSCLSNISPGSLEDWPITEQAKLFSIFGDTERLIGVRLTASMLMVPRKSISGILFPSEEGFVACQLCERGNCPSRKAEFAPQRSERE